MNRTMTIKEVVPVMTILCAYRPSLVVSAGPFHLPKDLDLNQKIATKTIKYRWLFSLFSWEFYVSWYYRLFPFPSWHMLQREEEEEVQQQQQQGQQTGQQQKDSVQPIRVGGVVVTKAGLLEAKEEPCTFVFVPLWDSNHHYDCDAKSLSSSQLVVDSARSFACICLLPQPSSYSLSFNEKSSDDGSIQNDFIFGNTSILVDDDRHVNFLQVVWQSLEELIQWHRRC